jgi:hypothetical protein
MPIKYADIENAFTFVSIGETYLNSAYLCRETGQIFYTNEMGDSDELPDDIYENEQYIEIPHKNELDLGKALVLDFTSTHIQDDIANVKTIFRRKGAYAKFKQLLEDRGLLEEWYSFEEERQDKVLRNWCKENKISILD